MSGTSAGRVCSEAGIGVCWAALFLVAACGQPPETQHAVIPPQPAVTPSAVSSVAPPSDSQPKPYPETRRVEVVDDYHGVRVPDPYRWLESLDAPETRTWIESENKVTEAFLAGVSERAAIEKRLTELWNYARYGLPEKRGDRYFFTKNDGLQNQRVLYVMDGKAGAPRALLDPNVLSPDGTVALDGFAPSNDGKLVAYGLSDAGSDWIEWRVRNVATGKDLDDRLRWVKFSDASWMRDGRGFFYSRFPEPAGGVSSSAANYNHKIYFHRVGAPQTEDVLVYERPDHKEWMFHARVSDDGRYLVVITAKSTDEKVLVSYKDLSTPLKPGLTELVREFEAGYYFLGNRGSRFWFRTTLGATRGRVVSVDVRKQPITFTEVVPEAPDALDGVSWVGDRLILTYLKDARAEVRVHDLDGKLVESLTLPGVGTVRGFEGRQSDREAFYTFQGFATPPSVFGYDVRDKKSSVFRAPDIAFDPGEYLTEQIFVQSKDGTRVPAFVVRKKTTPLGPSTPTYLYGYGGFKISLTPWFDVAALVWMEMGGVYVVPNLRGGGEYGSSWHEAGIKEKKQRVFDDFIAVAEWLVKHGYTSTPKLAIGGRSNGGLLIGACMTQRPELFGATLPQVGVMDMLRYHKNTIGWAWSDEFGNADEATSFRTLFAYSPLHNVRPGTRYPPTLITTADHDDRVVPWHSFKFAAALQAAQAGSAPTLIRIETRAGHGAGMATSKIIREQADKWAFLVRALAFQPAKPEKSAATQLRAGQTARPEGP